MAIRTTRPTRGDLRHTAYCDDRTAPKTTLRYCRACGSRLLADLIVATVDGDALLEADPASP